MKNISNLCYLNDVMRDASPSPEQARREYWKNRESKISVIKSALSVLGSGGGIWPRHNARRVLHSMEPLEGLVHSILANKDKIYISKQVMENLLEDVAWLEKVRAKAEHFLNR